MFTFSLNLFDKKTRVRSYFFTLNIYWAKRVKHLIVTTKKINWMVCKVKCDNCWLIREVSRSNMAGYQKLGLASRQDLVICARFGVAMRPSQGHRITNRRQGACIAVTLEEGENALLIYNHYSFGKISVRWSHCDGDEATKRSDTTYISSRCHWRALPFSTRFQLDSLRVRAFALLRPAP